MARTNKIGVDYFPLDVDFFQDDKIQLVEAEFGVKGGYIAVRLLCKIYNEGYFYRWGADECLLFAKNIGVDGVSKSVVDEVVKGLVKRGFFNESVFNSFGVLTSAGIQTRYFEITKRYKSVDVFSEYLLVDVAKFDNVNIIPINVDINSINANTNRQKKRNINNNIYIKEISTKVDTKKSGREENDGDDVASPPQDDFSHLEEEKKIPVDTPEQERKKVAPKKESQPPPQTAPTQLKSDDFIRFEQWILKKAPQVAKFKEPFTQAEFERLKAEFDAKSIQEMLLSMHNYKPLLTKNVNANLTFRRWMRTEKERTTSNRSHQAQEPKTSKVEKMIDVHQEIQNRINSM